MPGIKTIRCTHVLAQVSLGFYDEAGNLVSEETFPQVEGNVAAARLFHPHSEQLNNLISTCIDQAWVKWGPPTERGEDRGETPSAGLKP